MSSANAQGIPSVDRVLTALGRVPLPRPLTARLVRETVQELRESGDALEDWGGWEGLMIRVRGRIDALFRSRIAPVINGTGVLIHTNLGRAPLAEGVARSVAEVARSYSVLEFDLECGERGRRGGFVETVLAELLAAEAATVVNNCAAALVLILGNIVRSSGRREVVISRGELVEIGGGFRVPAILEASGARLREVGTTNRTTIEDYAGAMGPDTALLLKVHRSNFFMEGFVQSPATEELAALGRERGVPVVEDQGSGALVRTGEIACVEHEPTVPDALRRGVDLVCCSGDKLLGGPQSGVIAGKADRVAALKKDPLFRALRCDKLILAALQETALVYLKALETGNPPELPLMHMLGLPVETLQVRAERMAGALEGSPGTVRIGKALSRIGGGTMPKSTLESVSVDLRPQGGSAQDLARRLRQRTVPVIGYIDQDWWRLDLRTVFEHQDAAATLSLREELARKGPCP
ncbi:MAG TPA: L-seryl-tRNA(Sec) selenium transferase [Verrucomicrobiales bacterium]|nr:L-seryl-tRNA(Sec) selenium transferase [Verrucomicrobiales bacterium]